MLGLAGWEKLILRVNTTKISAAIQPATAARKSMLASTKIATVPTTMNITYWRRRPVCSFFSWRPASQVAAAVALTRPSTRFRSIQASMPANCRADQTGNRVFIHALRDLQPGEELFYDYGLVIDERYTPKLKKEYECRCGSPNCRRTMLSPKR